MKPWWHHVLFGWRLLDGWLIALVLFLMVVVTLTACAPPQQLHGVEAFDAWQRANVQLVNVDLPPGACDRWENGAGILLVDVPCMVERSYGDPTHMDFQLRHGQGHAVDFRLLGFARGVSGCTALTCKSFEESAQCVGEVASARTVAQDPAQGYWDCPDAEVERFRGLMVAAGVW